MGESPVSPAPPAPRRALRVAILLAAAWTVIAAASLAWSVADARRDSGRQALTEARGSLGKDILFQQWIARHGGVYVDETTATPPNPYLAHLPDRDIVTVKGRRLTLMNAAYAMRQIYEMGEGNGVVRGHFTSLDPLRPGNAPDPWEQAALEAFSRGVKERSGEAAIDGEPYLRLMRPMMTEEVCLKCHGEQGYRVGDVRGGISVSIPLAPYLAAFAAHRRDLAVRHGLLFLLGLAGIAAAGVLLHRRDIARLQTGAALHESEERFRTIFENAAEGILIADVGSRRLTSANPAICRFLGYTEAELMRLKVRDIHPAADLDRVVEVFEAQARGEYELAPELPCLRKDGTVVYADIRSTPMTVGGRRYLIGLFTDVSGRRRSLEALRESEARYRDLVEGTEDIVTVVDGEGRFTFVNSRAAAVFGLSAADCAGRSAFDFVHPEDRERTRTWFEACVRERRGTASIENRQVNEATGQTRHILWNGTFHFDEAGNVDRAGGIGRDLTERRRLEEQIFQSQKLEGLGVLAGGIAHDFNNLLMGIMGNTELAQSRVPPESVEGQYLLRAREAADRAAELVGQMLAYAGKGEITFEFVDLNALVDGMAHLLKASLTGGAQLKLDLAAAAPWVMADSTQLRQIAMNLVTNAAEALGGEGTVTLSTGALEADRDYLGTAYLDDGLQAGRYAFIEVSDTGRGMDEETKARIFEPFFSTKFPGRGLGMAAVLGIVRRHRGAVFLESAPGEGTTVRILIPAAEAGDGAAARRDASAPAQEAGGGCTLLVIDDEAAARETTAALLEELGCRVLAAADGPSGLELFRRRRGSIDAVICDLTMPGMGGVEVCRELNRLAPGVPVVLSSGVGEEDLRDRTAGLACAAFLRKPYRLAELKRTIAGIL